MKLLKSVFEVDVYGSVVKLKKATYNEAEEYYDKINACGNDPKAIAKTVKEFLISKGLSEENFKELENDHVSELIDLVLGVTKK